MTLITWRFIHINTFTYKLTEAGLNHSQHTGGGLRFGLNQSLKSCGHLISWHVVHRDAALFPEIWRHTTQAQLLLIINTHWSARILTDNNLNSHSDKKIKNKTKMFLMTMTSHQTEFNSWSHLINHSKSIWSNWTLKERTMNLLC